MDFFRHKETGELFNHHELLSFSLRTNGPNFEPFYVTPDVMELLQVEFVKTLQQEEALTKYQFVSGLEIVKIDGLWYRRPVVGEHTTEESRADVDRRQLEDLRRQRDFYLSETDWTQLGDVPEQTKAKYATYRQQLRDITTVAGFPDAFEWPTKPE
jgi:hypothetical protein